MFELELTLHERLAIVKHCMTLILSLEFMLSIQASTSNTLTMGFDTPRVWYSPNFWRNLAE